MSTCADPSDYTGGVFNVTFQPGEVRKMVSLTITDDEYSECPEKFLARLGIPERSTALGVVKGEPDMTTVDISDNDVIICSVDDSDSIVTVNEGVGAVNVCISCSGKSSNRFTVQLLTTDDEATGGSCDSHMTITSSSHDYHMTGTWWSKYSISCSVYLLCNHIQSFCTSTELFLFQFIYHVCR